jgi:serine/threonine-protein kinase
VVSELFRQRYELLNPIGEGGMGVVYRALDKRCDRIVAVKVLHRSLLTDLSWVRRFFAEARACAKLSHPNTILVLDCGVTDSGLPFISMEYLGGNSLRAIMRADRLSPRRVLRILMQCCASLAEAHAFGIIHRDIKPENVFLTDHFGSPDHVKLLDFSIAKVLDRAAPQLTVPGHVLGTPEYMSPDHLSGNPLDARTDIYSLGVLAYEMLTGGVPYLDPNPMMILRMHSTAPVPELPVDIPDPVAGIVLRSLQKEPDRRFQGALDMLERCGEALEQLDGSLELPRSSQFLALGSTKFATDGEEPPK